MVFKTGVLRLFMEKYTKKDLKVIGNRAIYRAKYNVLVDEWTLEVQTGSKETYDLKIGMLFTTRNVERSFISLETIQNFLSECRVSAFIVLTH